MRSNDVIDEREAEEKEGMGGGQGGDRNKNDDS